MASLSFCYRSGGRAGKSPAKHADVAVIALKKNLKIFTLLAACIVLGMVVSEWFYDSFFDEPMQRQLQLQSARQFPEQNQTVRAE